MIDPAEMDDKDLVAEHQRWELLSGKSMHERLRARAVRDEFDKRMNLVHSRGKFGSAEDRLKNADT